ncbi:MAG: hypothetical protein ABIH76_03315, partial [Candidatus Bathyarchaeota archaeon]
IPKNIVDYFAEYLNSVFRLDDDLERFYDNFNLDPISQTFGELRGLRLMKATNAFESLICSICSQNTSVEMWNLTVNCIKRNWGRKYSFRDGGRFFTFPTSKVLVKVNEPKLQACSLGYRSKYILDVSRQVENHRLKLEILRKKGYNDVYEALLKIRGIGPKVGDCFCLYGLGFNEAAPVDRWVSRVVSHLYFDNEPKSDTKIRKFIQKHFDKWAGYAQLYLFHAARTILRDKALGLHEIF